MHEVQCSAEGAVFEMALPHKQGKLFGRLPGMRIEHGGACKSVNPKFGLGGILNARWESKGLGVERNGHFSGLVCVRQYKPTSALRNQFTVPKLIEFTSINSARLTGFDASVASNLQVQLL